MSGVDILGMVVAHELGHMLLPEVPHRERGLMQGRWNAAQLQRAAQGALGFTDAEAALLRSRVNDAVLPLAD